MSVVNLNLTRSPRDTARLEQLIAHAGQRQCHLETINWQDGTQLPPEKRKAAARFLSQVLYGEQSSLRLVGNLLETEPDPLVRQFLQTQLRDEACHAAAFERYLNLLGGIEPPNPYLQEMVETMLLLPGTEEKIIGMHILVEGMALEIFSAAARRIPDPLLKEILHAIHPDESRHVAFGTLHAKNLVANLSDTQKEQVAHEARHYATVSTRLINSELENAAIFGLDLKAVQRRTQLHILRRLWQIGIASTVLNFGWSRTISRMLNLSRLSTAKK